MVVTMVMSDDKGCSQKKIHTPPRKAAWIYPPPLRKNCLFFHHTPWIFLSFEIHVPYAQICYPNFHVFFGGGGVYFHTYMKIVCFWEHPTRINSTFSCHPPWRNRTKCWYPWWGEDFLWNSPKIFQFCACWSLKGSMCYTYLPVRILPSQKKLLGL